MYGERHADGSAFDGRQCEGHPRILSHRAERMLHDHASPPHRAVRSSHAHAECSIRGRWPSAANPARGGGRGRDLGPLPVGQAPPVGLSGVETQLQRQKLPGDVVDQDVQEAVQVQPVMHWLRPGPLGLGGKSCQCSNSSDCLQDKALRAHQRFRTRADRAWGPACAVCRCAELCLKRTTDRNERPP